MDFGLDTDRVLTTSLAMILDTSDYIVPAVHRSDRKKGFLALFLDLHHDSGASIEIFPKFRVCPRCAIVINMGKS